MIAGQAMRRKLLPVRGLVLSAAILAALPAPAQRTLRVTPGTIQWGYFAADAKPAITVKPGETLTIDTIVGVPDWLEQLGARIDDPIREMREMYANVKERGPGPHFLTGPVAIEGAMPGDVLEVQIVDVRLRSPYGWMAIEPGAGTLPEEFPYLRKKLVPLNGETGMAEFLPGIRIPVRPFFGNLGVAPPEGKLGSAPPSYNAGNLDNKWLVAGSRVYIPVQVPGAMFAVGDGHAAQGDGEVSVTAIETNLTGVFRFAVHKNMHLRWPRAETPTHYITMGLDPDLNEAARRATREMIDYLTTARGLSRDDAYMLTSAAVDLHVTQLVDGTKGVHAMLPKSIFTGGQAGVVWPEGMVRGANMPFRASEEDVAHFARDWHGQVARILVNSITSPRPPYDVSEEMKARVFAALDRCLEHGLITVFSPSASFENNDAFFTNEEWLAAFRSFWKEVAVRYRDKGPIVYDLINEPWGSEARRRWNSYARELTAAIREIDTRHTIMVEPAEWGWAGGFPYLEPTGDKNTVYSFHFYGPMDFTHQRNQGHMKTTAEQWKERVYPGPLQGEQWDKQRFRKEIALATAWRDKHNARIWCGEFGVARWARGADRWMKEWIEALEEEKIGWAYYEYRGWQHMDMEMDAASREPTVRGETDLSRFFKTYFALPR